MFTKNGDSNSVEVLQVIIQFYLSRLYFTNKYDIDLLAKSECYCKLETYARDNELVLYSLTSPWTRVAKTARDQAANINNITIFSGDLVKTRVNFE